MATQAASDKGHLGFLISGFFSLFIISFLDNSRGPILPVLCEKLKIPYETAGTFLTIGCIAAVVSTLTLNSFLRHYGERKVALGVAMIGLIPGCLAPFVDSVTKLMTLGALMGASITLMGTLCNILTIEGSPHHLRGRHLSFQQVMYGVGSLLAPLAFARLLRSQLDWSWMLVGCSIAIFFLGIAFYVLLPDAILKEPEATLPTRAISRQAYFMVLLFALYVGGEVLASMWMSTLIVGRQGKLPEQAAIYGIVFFALIAGTRFLCFLFVKPAWEPKILVGSLLTGIMFAILGQRGYTAALPLIGFVGPFFPLCMARISREFPEDWKAITVYVFIAIQALLAFMHQSVGTIADAMGIENAFLLCPALFALSLVFLIHHLAQSKKPSIPSAFA